MYLPKAAAAAGNRRTEGIAGPPLAVRILAFGLLPAAFLTPCLAHHNTSALFDMESEVTVEGTVVGFDWSNPHVYVEVAAPSVDGDAQVWRFEGRPLAFMRLSGWTRGTLRLGDRVTVTANPSRKTGRTTGFLADLVVEGRAVPALRGPAFEARLERQVTVSDGRTNSLSGTWITVSNPDVAWISDPTELSLTAAGRAAVAAFDESTMHPGLECTPYSAPVLMLVPDVKSIEIRESIGWIRGEFDGAQRTIYFDGREPAGATVHGHSRGRWEDGDLVIETTSFSDHRMGNAFSLPSGSRKRLIERLELEDDGTALRYFFELIDPQFLAEPVTGEARWLYRPSTDFELLPCDVENSRLFLED